MPTSSRSPVRIIAIASFAFVLLWAAWTASDVLFLLFGSVLLSLLLGAIADWLSSKLPSRDPSPSPSRSSDS